jgi:hypothetical protein
MWAFINAYIEENARLGNRIAVNRLAVLSRIWFEMLRTSQHPVMRLARKTVKRVLPPAA